MIKKTYGAFLKNLEAQNAQGHVKINLTYLLVFLGFACWKSYERNYVRLDLSVWVWFVNYRGDESMCEHLIKMRFLRLKTSLFELWIWEGCVTLSDICFKGVWNWLQRSLALVFVEKDMLKALRVLKSTCFLSCMGSCEGIFVIWL